MASRGGRGGRGGARGGRGGGGAFGGRGGLTIGGVEVGWDLTGINIQKGPAEAFPPRPAPLALPPTTKESSTLSHYLAVRDRIHEGPFYTILADGMTSGKKRRPNEAAPTDLSLFNPFTDNQTYTSKYMKVRRRIPKLDMRPYGEYMRLCFSRSRIANSITVTEFFPLELQPLIGDSAPTSDGPASKKRKTLQIAKTADVKSKIDGYMEQQDRRIRDQEERGEDDDEFDEEEEEEEEKPDAVDEEDNWSAVSSDSEESGDDYNAEQYFDNGDEDDIDPDGDYENSYE